MHLRRWKVLLPLFVLVAAVSVVAVAAASTTGSSAVIPPSPAFTPDQLAAPAGLDWITAGGGLTGSTLLVAEPDQHVERLAARGGVAHAPRNPG